MDKTQQRIKIAEACGWKDIERCARKSLKPHPDGAELRGTLDPVTINYTRTYSRLPDYLNDLNAMHEAEKVLTATQFDNYRKNLAREWMTSDDDGMWAAINATAEQRAEAFLRTLGLW